MSLLSFDIPEKRKLFFKEILPVEEVAPPPVVSKPRATALEDLLAINPDIGYLVDTFGLEIVGVNKLLNDTGIIKARQVAQSSLKPRAKYTRDEAIQRIQVFTRISRERAEKGFILMLEIGAIKLAQGYYLLGNNGN